MDGNRGPITKPRRGGLPTAIAQAPLRTVRPAQLSAIYANPSKELLRLYRQQLVYRLGCGAYIGIPDAQVGIAWQPSTVEAAMAYAASVFGEDVPILAGIGAARWWGLIPREMGICPILVPRQHRNVMLTGGIQVCFSISRYHLQDTELVTCQLGQFRVQTREQTLLDLVSRPEWGQAPSEAINAAKALLGRANTQKVAKLARDQKLQSAWDQFFENYNEGE